MSFLSRIFGESHERLMSTFEPLVRRINALEAGCQNLSDARLKEKTAELRQKLQEGATLDDLLPEAFALVREAAKRTLGQRHFDVQLLGGMVLHQGKIAEMKTGEGKTLVATLPAYGNALAGRGVHVVTVNDYLAKRDAVWMGQIYRALGLSVGCIVHEAAYLYDPDYGASSDQALETKNQKPKTKNHDALDRERDTVGAFKIVEDFLRLCTRKEAYAADITYGTNNEFGFDYLRDNMAYHADDAVQIRKNFTADDGAKATEDMAQRGHHYAIVDEVDSILIDEARTPLIISMPDAESTKLYETFTRLVPRLTENADYNIDEKLRAVTLTDAGIEKVEKMLGFNIYDPGGVRYVHALEQSLRAHALFQRDRDYVVKDGEVIIVDEFTGRLMPGRRWSEGLHQAVEAKEKVRVQQESRTLATITFQNYFRMYGKLAGMTGTALTSAEEFDKVYKLDVVPIPTNKTMIRQDASDQVYKTEGGKFQAVVEEIKECHERGQPVLVGTISIEKNERLSEVLKRVGIPHEVLNAKNHEREGAIIAQAGRFGAVTVATNMAGRGVDIILGGNPQDPEQSRRVREVGGLHVIGTERHEARRIDNQLRGRSGRQGDQGSSQFFVSLEDEIMRIFGGERLKSLMDRLNVPEDMPIEHSLVSKSIESAQAKIEGHNFDIRKHILEYDEVMNKHRTTIYARRRDILDNAHTEEIIHGYIENEIKKILDFHAAVGNDPSAWNTEEIFEVVRALAPQDDENLPAPSLRGAEGDVAISFGKKLNELRIKNYESRTELEAALTKFFRELYETRKAQFGETMAAVEKTILLRTLDMLWVEHLETMEHLRDSVRLRAYGQRDPLVEYKNEAHKLFEQLLASIQTNVVNMIFKAIPAGNRPEAEGRRIPSEPVRPISNQDTKNIGRNDPCPCGSGRKFKKCHGK